MLVAEGDSEALSVGRACLEDLTSERAWMTVETEQAKAEPDTFATRIHELEVAAAM